MPMIPTQRAQVPTSPNKPPKATPAPRGEPKNQAPFTRPVGVKPTNTPVSTATGPHPKPPAGPPPLTDQQQISAWVQAAQLPMMQEIEREQEAAQAAADAHAASVKGYYQALAGILSNIGAGTRGGYQQAAGADAAFGKGFSDGLQQVQSGLGTQDTNILGISGAPASQGAELGAVTGNTGAADALFGVGGYIPASTLEREGAAFGAAADRLPATAAGQGAQTLNQVYADLATQVAGFNKQRSDLAAQVPGLALQYGQQLQSQHAAAAAAAERVREWGITTTDREAQAAAQQRDRSNQLAWEQYQFGVKNAQSLRDYNQKVKENNRSYNLQVAKLKQQQDIFNAKQAATDTKVDTPLSKARGYLVNSQGDYIPGPDGMPQMLPGGPGGTKTKVLSPAGVGSFLKSIMQQQKVWDPTTNSYAVDKNKHIVYQSVPRMQYEQAYNYLTQTGHLSDKAARKALNTVYPKGQGGRSWFTNEQQAALVRAGDALSHDQTITLNDVVDPATGQPSTRGYLTLPQVKVLRKAGLLPAGFWHSADSGHNVWVLKPGY